MTSAWVIALCTTLASGIVPPRPTLLRARAEAPSADSMIAQTKAAIEAAAKDPDRARASLREALAALEAEPSTAAKNPGAHKIRISALLALAKAELAMDREPQAIAALDTAIRIARGEPLPIDESDAKLSRLHELRLGAPELRPAGSILVTCSVACAVILDGRNAGQGNDVQVTGLPLGGHQLRVEALSDDIDEHLHEDLMLSADSPARTFAFTVDTSTAGGKKPDVRDTGPQPVKPRRLPRWAGILGIGVGAALTVSGAVLIAFDGKCPDGSDPTGADPCTDVLNTDGVGIALTAIGAAALVGFSVALGIGESRDRKRLSAALFTVRMRF